ncbi:MAG: HAD family acid phosphatase, partial [Gemmatimonadota bacterium]
MEKTRPFFGFAVEPVARVAMACAGRVAMAPTVKRAAVAGLVAAGLAACAPAVRTPSPAMPAPTPPSETAGAAAVPRADPLLAFEWVRGSAEHRAVYVEIYRAATAQLDSLAAGRAAGTWGVILDGDETILDNSSYEADRAERGLGFTEESWSEWVRKEAAPVLPGARSFLERVHALGGRVVIVTNRREALCA